MGRVQDTNEAGRSASERHATGRRLGWRTCLRKGCGRSFRARQWNQRYCEEPECRRLVRRWQATRRQRARRASPEGREQHAEAERARRQRSTGQSKPTADGDWALAMRVGPGAWSRSETPLPRVVCDRPGCYEPPRDSRRTPASYCSDACRAAMRRVRDRERKYLARKTKAGRLKRRLEYAATAKKRLGLGLPNQGDSRPGAIAPGVAAGRIAVGGYGEGEGSRLPFRQSAEVAERVRRPPTSGWSWIDRRFLRERAPRLRHEAILLYFFLAAVSDKDGLSFYSDASIAVRLRMTEAAVVAAGERFGAVILDPPKFARSRSALQEALRAYHWLNRLAVQLLEPGGVLVTCSCSGHVTREDFFDMLIGVAQQTRREIQILQQRGAAPDHPVAVTCPEGEYLKCFICRVA
jgi:hypothetical protein